MTSKKHYQHTNWCTVYGSTERRKEFFFFKKKRYHCLYAKCITSTSINQIRAHLYKNSSGSTKNRQQRVLSQSHTPTRGVTTTAAARTRRVTRRRSGRGPNNFSTSGGCVRRTGSLGRDIRDPDTTAELFGELRRDCQLSIEVHTCIGCSVRSAGTYSRYPWRCIAWTSSRRGPSDMSGLYRCMRCRTRGSFWRWSLDHSQSFFFFFG